MKVVRVGLIGCGGIAKRAHLPAMAHLTDRLRLVATADINAAAAQEAAAPWGATAYTDYTAILERKDVDMVLIATPEFLHRDQVVAAAEAGKQILCEKPMAPSLAEADDMLRACQRAGVRLMIGHSRRFTRRYLEVRQAIDRGEIGEVRLGRENERRPRPPVPRQGGTASALQARSEGYWIAGHWTSDPKLSLGTALTNGIHEMDLLRWFTGAEPVAIAAEHNITVQGNPGVPDFLSFMIHFDNGAIGSAEIANCIPPSYPAFHQFELYGNAGAIRAKDQELLSITHYRDDGADFPDSSHILLHHLAAYVREQAAFIQAMQTDSAVPLAPENGRAALELALAAVESARSGKVVRLGPAGKGGRTA